MIKTKYMMITQYKNTFKPFIFKPADQSGPKALPNVKLSLLELPSISIELIISKIINL
jgi:hypothetical protein